jgi:hypothetical protein
VTAHAAIIQALRTGRYQGLAHDERHAAADALERPFVDGELAHVHCAKSADGTILTASEIYVDGRRFVSADSLEAAHALAADLAGEKAALVERCAAMSSELEAARRGPTSPASDPVREAVLALLKAKAGGYLGESPDWHEHIAAVRR